MEIVNYGRFEPYIDPTSPYYQLYKNAEGHDWNEMQMGRQEGIPKIVELGPMGVFVSSIHPVWCMVDDSGVVTNVEFDPSRMVPYNKTILGFNDAAMEDVEPGMLYQDGELLPKPYVPPPPYTISVAVMWSRFADDAEAEAFDTAMSTASPFRLRKAFQSASQLTSGTELFTFVEGVLASSISEQRAEEILAPPAAGEAAAPATEVTA